MSGLIEEIQKDALNIEVPIDSLLRKMKLAAAKLDLGVIESWVEQELNGYDSSPPDYRTLWGKPAAWNPYNGWIPIHTEDEKFMNLISTAYIRQSVASIQDLALNQKENTVHLPMQQAAINLLNKNMDFQSPRMVIQLTRSHLIGLLNHVRNMCLDWSIEMEKKGILGQGLSFNDKEKQSAKESHMTFNIGTIGNFTGNLGSDNSAGDISASDISVEKIKSICTELEKAKNDLVAHGVDAASFQSLLNQITEEVNGKNPEGSRIKSLLEDIRTATATASGSVIGEGTLALITAALGSLGV